MVISVSTLPQAFKTFIFLLQMVRNYKRKSQQHSWSVESMQEAVNKVKNGEMSKKAASKAYNVPRTTLIRRLADEKIGDRVRTLFIWIIDCSSVK